MFQGLAHIELAKARHDDHIRALDEAIRCGRATHRGRWRIASRLRRHHARAGATAGVAA